jgi:hypothetical protein
VEERRKEEEDGINRMSRRAQDPRSVLWSQESLPKN